MIAAKARRTKVGKRYPGIYWREAANGKRRYEFDFYDEDGVRRWQVVDGKLADAEAARAEKRRKRRQGECVRPTKATFAEVADKWLAAQTQLRPRTREVYTWALERHVKPRLGRRPIASIREDDVTALIGAMQAQGKAPWTIRAVLTPLSRVMSYAVRQGWLAGNPVRRLERGERPPAVELREKRILSGEEVGKLLDAVLPTYRPILATAAFSGLRLGELCGLTWADVDFEAGLIRVRKQLDRDGNRVEPKTAQAKRDVVLMPSLAPLLRRHKAASAFSKGTDFVFASKVGTPAYWRNVSRRGLEKAAGRAGLHGDGRPTVTMHSLRHTYASHLILDLKLDPVQVSKQLGHAKPSITSDTYARLFEEARHAEDIRKAMAGSAYGTILERLGGDGWRNPGDEETAKVAICGDNVKHGNTRRQAGSALQAGGGWFEPGTAHKSVGVQLSLAMRTRPWHATGNVQRSQSPRPRRQRIRDLPLTHR